MKQVKQSAILILLLLTFIGCSKKEKYENPENFVGTVWKGSTTDGRNVSLGFTANEGCYLNIGGTGAWYDYEVQNYDIYLRPKENGDKLKCSVASDQMKVVRQETNEALFILFKSSETD
ncbi:MAG: hypothetical protein LUF90_02155 [Rikenellaceae bacterium]|nr:hypothetical protein [Rikenellaceae bacterium]